MLRIKFLSFLILLGLAVSAPAIGQAPESGGKLLFTRGISTLEGAGGGAISSWALITGNETERGIGASAHYTSIIVDDFTVRSFGGALGFYDRFELSYTKQEFDTRSAGEALGLGAGFEFDQDIIGAKLRLIGDAVYDQDKLLPQIALGVQYKKSNRSDLVQALGADDNDGVDVYLAATKLFLSQSLLVNATVRYTRANQFGLLGFGAADGDDGSFQPELTVGYQLSRRWFVGGEYRFKPNQLAFADEGDAFDIFAAFAVHKNLTLTAAYADIGDVATFDNQRGAYLTLQVGF